MLRGAPATGTFSWVNEGWFGPLSSDCSRRWMPGGLRWALKAAVPFMEVRGGAVQKAARAMEGKGQGSKQGRVREASRLTSTRFHFLLTLQRSCIRRRRRAGCGGPVYIQYAAVGGAVVQRHRTAAAQGVSVVSCPKKAQSLLFYVR